MFEGLVRQLLVGYLGRYIKDIQKEQLKIGVWNEEVLLENVELILEAFDYLQLPFALKHGRVGRLSIKIPWKKLGWDPIIIVLEDVFICACQRFDHEWSLDLVERREFASKKAKLAAAELAKLSRRVCDNQAGQSFISYITAKILDGIQVSIRNVHVIYIDKQNDSAQFVFGLRFSTLTIMTDSRVKPNSVGSSIGKSRGGQVNKTVEIFGLGIYCNMFRGTPNFWSVDSDDDSGLYCDANFDWDSYDYILEPVDVTVTLVVNKSGKLENGVPQYAVIADLTALVISLNEIQLQQILFLWDFLYLCTLKEKYGRYRPLKYPLSRKPDGWQKMWWHYAQESILSDVRRKLRNTFWSNLGRRISFRRKYVSLYKTKLDFLQQEQPVNEDILLELEQMEKESEVDDILSYRSIAERQLQERVFNSACTVMGTDGADTTEEKQRNDELLSSRPQGWLNWLSLGMLGAGGTADSSQFTGVVSDEIIKDIYEATKFHPMPSSEWGTSVKGRFYLASVSFNIHQITAMLRSKRHNKNTTCVTFDGVSLQCELWEDSSVIHCLINSVEVLDPSTHKVMLLTKKAILKESLSQHGQPSISVQVEISPANHDIEFLVKVVLQPFEVTYDSDFLVDILDFHHALGSVQFQHERVLSSLNGFENFEGRLLAKAEYILLNRTKVTWDISFNNVIIKIPWTNEDSELFIMVLELGLISFKSRLETDPFASASEEQYDYLSTIFQNSNYVEDMSLGIQLQDLYDHFEIQLTGFGVNIMVLNSPPAISVLERFDASIFVRSCIFLDESMLKQLEVHCIVPSLCVHFAPSIFDALFRLSAFLNISQKNPEPVDMARNDLHIIGSGPKVFQFSVYVSLGSANLHVNLEDDAENSLILGFALEQLNIQYTVQQFVEYRICMKILEIHTSSLRSELNNQVLFSSRNSNGGTSGHQNGEDFGLGTPSETFGERNAPAEGCLLLHYQAKAVRNICHQYTICLNNVDLHCYPRIIGLLLEFFDKLSGYGISSSSAPSVNISVGSSKDRKLMSGIEPQKYGFSNFYETGSNALASIPIEQFPFVTICNSGSLSSLESALIQGIHEWRRTFHVRDRKSFKSQRFTSRKWSKLSSVSTSKFAPSIDDEIFVLDWNLNGIRLHFHDSSCILGTITLPVSAIWLFFLAPDCWDIFCSIEGLVISSSWFTPDIHEFLWGPSLTNLSTILNIRLRKVRDQALIPEIQISVGIQHVCCVLVPEFLAMIIGYFSLPDWNLNRNEQHATENYRYGNIKDKPYELIYKFEILDCTLVLPTEKDIHYALQLGFEQLYFSFIPESNPTDALRGIPHECMLPAHKVADRLHIVNVFGRGTSLSLVLLKDDGQFMLKLGQDTSFASIPLILPLDADLWIRIPCETLCSDAQSALATCIMMRVESCQIIAEEEYFFCGLKAVMDAIIQLSSVGKESEGFTSDVIQFLQLRRSLLQDSDDVRLNASNDTFTEARLWVNELSVKLYRSRRTCSWPSELVAKADVQLNFSASLRNDILLSLDADVSSLIFISCYNSVTLLQCNSGDSIYSSLDIHFSKSDRGENVVVLAIPCFDIWLHMSDWNEVIDLLSSYTRDSGRPSTAIKSSKESHSGPVDPTDNLTVSVSQDAPESQKSNFTSESFFLTSVDLIMKSVNIVISIHFPLSVKEEAMDTCGDAKVQNDTPREFEAKYCKYVAIIMHSRDCELAISGRYVQLKANFEKIRGMLEMMEKQRVSSLPFFQVFQVNVAAEVCEKQQKFVHVTADVQIEALDMWLAHQIFHFARDVRFEIPGTSSQIPFHNLDFKIYLRKASLLLSDGRWSCNGPILEILMRNLLVHANQMEYTIEASVAGELLANYNNIHKVMWEPFIEPWNFQLNMVRKQEQELLNASITTDIHINSAAQFNLNFTEPLVEAAYRGNEMIKDALGQIGALDLPENRGSFGSQTTDNVYARRYAPYILQNDTSLPLSFQVSHSLSNEEDVDIVLMKKENVVHPGFSLPIYIDETPEDRIFRHRPTYSSERLNEKKSNGAAHHMISIQLDGTSRPSKPMSMDLVGLSCFDVDFSKTSDSIEVDKAEHASRYNRITEEPCRTDPNSGFVVPVVFEVSIQRYSKLIRLFSTVILLNATSMPLELRFDIPFGVSPKVLGPIFPGQEFPLPLHLAESGRMRWRPLGTNYLWSEAHPLSNILSQENRLGILRSSICYPSHPSSDPFRCCISVQDISLSSSNGAEKGSSVHMQEAVKQSFRRRGQRFHKTEKSKTRYIHLVKLTTPLLIKNYLPVALSLTIESVGVTRSILLSEVDTVSIFHIDSTHDLGVLFHMDDFKTVILKFPRAEIFTETAKLSESKFSLSEILTFYPDSSNGPICVSVEKVMDASCGARELCISIPFLLYNCTGLSLSIVDGGNEKKENGCLIPSCYDLIGQSPHLVGKHGLALLSFEQDSSATPPNINGFVNVFSKTHTITSREHANLHSRRFLNSHFSSSDSSTHFLGHSENHNLDAGEVSSNNLVKRQSTNSLWNLSRKVGSGHNLIETSDNTKVKACMYSPPSFLASELIVRLTTRLPECVDGNIQSSMWSSPFSLAPASGSASVIIPQNSTCGAFIISVTSTPVSGALSGRTRAITFQPRYVISNACSKELCYKQKGTDFFYRLGVGQHSHLHWTDMTRELLVSIRFNEPGWQWSGSFLPDQLGDALVKMRNYASGTLNMVWVEVQNVDVSIKDEKIVGSSNGNPGTHLILLSDDNTGFMPYRIENFSSERLRIYQQKCESFETIIHSYTSCPYAWDEPCYPHRLVVEVPGERVMGSYSLDDVKEYIPVYLPPTSEKPERRIFLSIHAEGAVKVLSIIDSSYHAFEDMKDASFAGFKGKNKVDVTQETQVDFSERITVHMSFIGISLINSSPQELVFACAKDLKIDVLQSLDQQKFSFQISSLQIDNQLRNTPYPVILFFDSEMKNKEDKLKIKNGHATPTSSDAICQPIFYLAAAKWRNKDSSLVSFEYINLRLAPLRVELEEQVLLSLFDFFRTVTSRIQSRALRHSNFEQQPLGPHARDYTPMNISSSQLYSVRVSKFLQNNKSNPSLPSVVPIGAPWQQIFRLARRQKKIYIEVLDLAPIKLVVSFSSTPWMLRNETHTAAESLRHVSSTAFQRGLMALVDVEGAPVYLRQLTLAHHMASWESIQEILIRHYTWQILHEMYKVFGSAGVIGNPMGFARNVGLGIRDFLSVPAKGILQSPAGLVTGMGKGTMSLIGNTVYAISNATTQFSKAAHKGIVAFTFDEQAVGKMEKQQKGLSSHSKGVLNEFLEGLTGFLQSPIKGAEKHGLPGVLSGIALGTAGLIARPVASILEVTGKTAQSIRNQSSLHQPNRSRIRFPRPLTGELPLIPYSWEEAIGISMLVEADDSRLKDEIYVMCKALKLKGKFIIITERLVLIVGSPSLVGLGSPEFKVVADPEWAIEVELGLESVIHIDREREVVNIVGSSTETLSRQHQEKRSSSMGMRPWSPPSRVPLFQTSMEFSSEEAAENVLQVLWSTIEQMHGRGLHVLHQSNLRCK